jgi:hypothetical protein
MAYAAIIGALVNVGTSLFNEFGGTSAASRAGQYGNQLKQTALRYLAPYTGEGYWSLDLPGMAKQSLEFGYQQAPRLNQFNMTQLQRLLNQALPGYQDLVGTMTRNTQALLRGEIPQDVQDQIRTAGAETSMRGGFAGSEAARTLTARDLGLTSLQLEQQGETQAGNLISMGRNYLMPQMVNPTSLLPLSDLIGGAEWTKKATFSANQAMYTAMANAISAQFGAPPTQSGLGAGADIASLIGALGKKDSSGQSGLSSLFSMFGGGSGGGGMFGGGATGSSIDYASWANALGGA